MKKLSVSLTSCYGIKKLDETFDFTESNTYAVYAPNGMMKSSFEKTFYDLSKDSNTSDLVFSNRQTIRTIQDENGNNILATEVFTIKPYNESFETEKLSTLLVKQDLKRQYDEIYNKLDKEQADFIKKLKKTSLSNDCEDEIIDTFREHEKETFLDIIERVLPELSKTTKNTHTFRYNDIFDKDGKVKIFLEKNIATLDEYIKQYTGLVSNSKFFNQSDNSFGTYQAKTILKSIEDDSFFQAGHNLQLSDSSTIQSANEFNTYLESEIERVVNNPDLKKLFDKVDKAITGNSDLRKFKQVLENDNLLLVKLKNYEAFKKETWLNFLLEHMAEIESLVESYNEKKEEIKRIIDEAKSTQTEWKNATDEFNERFKGLPFVLNIKNKEDVILKTNTPFLEFTFNDSSESTNIDKNKLLNVLSQGEKRALYLLNIIFEIKARQKIDSKTIFIIDDIADSFDYKNKYAIIEYLKDISKIAKFYQIILTHNFDFFRTLESRFVGRKFSKMVKKTNDGIKIVDASYLKPFDYFKSKLHSDEKILLASIPFVRNLAEYIGKTNEFNILTSLLHIKSNTSSITIKDLEDIYKSILTDKSTLVLNNHSSSVFSRIYTCADSILTEPSNAIELESKIVLSIAIRLKAEEFMINTINNSTLTSGIIKNQTLELIKIFKDKFSNNTENIELLEQVNLMTPENIHLNSFMYEPILDMDNERLKNLYITLKNKENQ